MPNIALPELSVMQTIAEAIDSLTPSERRRVAAWFSEYAASADAAPSQAAVEAQSVVAADEEEFEQVDEQIDESVAEEEETLAAGPAIDSYRTFADLFDDVAPKSGAQKAVVAGYWLENKEDHESWKASEINKLLKSIDVKVSSISIVLSNAVKSKKTMVTELQRLGDSERSRKTFCLNEAGVAYVEDRIA